MFQEIWEYEFLFAENFFGKPECMICQYTCERVKQFFLSRHYTTCHYNYKNIIGEDRKKLILDLMKPFYEKMIRDSLETGTNQDDRHLKRKASFIVAAALAKRGRPFEDGQFFKELSKEVLDCLGVRGEDVKSFVNDIPLSSRTISRRIESISAFIYEKLRNEIINCKYFSICLDECTDVTDVAQLLVCVRTVDENFVIHEEMLSLVAITDHVKGKTIFDAVNEELFSFAEKEKFCSVCTDGANTMLGKNDGFIGNLLKNNFKITTFHCIIHQLALLAKNINLMNTMQISVQIINKLRGGRNALNHRKFKSFLEEVNAEFGDVIMFTDVRWLSKGRCLDRLFILRYEVIDFFEKNPCLGSNEIVAFLKDPNFILDLSFLADITEIVNQLNLQLQGTNKNICDLVFALEQFINRISILKLHLKSKNLTHFRRTSEIFKEFRNEEKIEEYISVLDNILLNYNNRFDDFNKIRKTIELHNNPLACKIDDQPAELRNELIQMQMDFTLPFSKGADFWKNVNGEKYPKLRNEILKLYSMFGTTYICEAFFSGLKYIKSKSRNSLSHSNVENILRIKYCPYKINVDEIVGNAS